MRVVFSKYPSKGGHVPLLGINLGGELRVVSFYCGNIVQEVSLFKYFGLVMSRGWGSLQSDCSLGPVDTRVIPHQPGISKNVVVLFTQVHHKETLDRVPLVDPKMEVNLIMDHSSLVIGPIGILSVYGVSVPLQRPFHPLGRVKVNATDCCPTV